MSSASVDSNMILAAEAGGAGLLCGSMAKMRHNDCFLMVGLIGAAVPVAYHLQPWYHEPMLEASMEKRALVFGAASALIIAGVGYAPLSSALMSGVAAGAGYYAGGKIFELIYAKLPHPQ